MMETTPLPSRLSWFIKKITWPLLSNFPVAFFLFFSALTSWLGEMKGILHVKKLIAKVFFRKNWRQRTEW